MHSNILFEIKKKFLHLHSPKVVLKYPSAQGQDYLLNIVTIFLP